MPGGQYDSSKTRVQPVFDALWARGRDWLPELLGLPVAGHPDAAVPSGTNLTLLEGQWEPNERGLSPPLALLSWLIRHPPGASGSSEVDDRRQRLIDGDPQTLDDALRLLRSSPMTRAWYVFEGPTFPDVFLVARDALVVIEGKRTEPGATTDTTWMDGRHQMWRHIDAAWEIRGRRSVYGFFIVQGFDKHDGGVAAPDAWRIATEATTSPEVLRSSFPHRSEAETQEIARCFLGVTTWRQVCERFGLDYGQLPHTTQDIPGSSGTNA